MMDYYDIIAQNACIWAVMNPEKSVSEITDILEGEFPKEDREHLMVYAQKGIDKRRSDSV